MTVWLPCETTWPHWRRSGSGWNSSSGSVKDTIRAEERNEIMSDEQKFEAFKQRAVKHNEETYGAEIRAKYGDQEVDEANAAVMNLTQAQYREWTTWAGDPGAAGGRCPGGGRPRRVRRARRSQPSTAGGSPLLGTGMIRPGIGASRSSM